MRKLTTVEAAAFCKVAPRTICKWCDMGRLKHSREDGTNNRLIIPSDLADFLRLHDTAVPDALAEMIEGK